MNKDFWDKVNRLEKLAGKATPSDYWGYGNNSDGIPSVYSHDKKGSFEIFNVGDIWGTEADAEYIAAANPAMIKEMIAEMRKLEKEADWLAEMQNISIYSDMPARCPEGRNPPRCPSPSCMECWREAARKAVSEADNA